MRYGNIAVLDGSGDIITMGVDRSGWVSESTRFRTSLRMEAITVHDVVSSGLLLCIGYTRGADNRIFVDTFDIHAKARVKSFRNIVASNGDSPKVSLATNGHELFCSGLAFTSQPGPFIHTFPI